MKTVYFVRHGQSKANVTGAHQSFEEPLTEHGLEQAQVIAKRVSRLPIEGFVASPLVRARQTAEIIAQKISKNPEFSDLFAECRGPKEFWGAPRDHPEAAAAFRELRGKYGTPGWRYSDEENYEDHTNRAQAALSFLAARSEQHILVVTHGLFLRILIAHSIFDMQPTPQEVQKITNNLEMANTGITILRHEENNVKPWRLWVFNDHAHLG